MRKSVDMWASGELPLSGAPEELKAAMRRSTERLIYKSEMKLAQSRRIMSSASSFASRETLS